MTVGWGDTARARGGFLLCVSKTRTCTKVPGSSVFTRARDLNIWSWSQPWGKVHRDSREIKEEISLVLIRSWLCSASESCTSAMEAKEMFTGSSCCVPSSCCGQLNPPFNPGICYSLAKTKSLSPFPFLTLKDPDRISASFKFLVGNECYAIGFVSV